MKKFIATFILFICAVTIGVGVYYFAPLSSKVLEQAQFKGKLTLIEAEKIVEDAGYTPEYSWYVVKDFTPIIEVMSRYNSQEGEIAVHAFTGKILKNPLESFATNAKKTGSPIPIKNTTELDDDLFSLIVERYPQFELVSTEEVEEWGRNLTYIYLWVDDHSVQISYDPENNELVEINEKFWQTKEGKDQLDTVPPEIEIIFPEEGAVFPSDTTSIEVKATVTDDTDPAPLVEGVGTIELKEGYNTIIVAASDSSGNASSKFVIIQRE